MAKTIGFGILGAGLIAPFHAKAVRDTHADKLTDPIVQTVFNSESAENAE